MDGLCGGRWAVWRWMMGGAPEEGPDALLRGKLMRPPFRGERMRSYEEVMRAAITAEIDSWPIGETFPIHPRMQSVTLEVILRAVFGVTDPARMERLRGLLRGVLVASAAPGLQLLGLATRRFQNHGPWAGFTRLLDKVAA